MCHGSHRVCVQEKRGPRGGRHGADEVPAVSHIGREQSSPVCAGENHSCQLGIGHRAPIRRCHGNTSEPSPHSPRNSSPRRRCCIHHPWSARGTWPRLGACTRTEAPEKEWRSRPQSQKGRPLVRCPLRSCGPLRSVRTGFCSGQGWSRAAIRPHHVFRPFSSGELEKMVLSDNQLRCQLHWVLARAIIHIGGVVIVAGRSGPCSPVECQRRRSCRGQGPLNPKLRTGCRRGHCPKRRARHPQPWCPSGQ